MKKISKITLIIAVISISFFGGYYFYDMQLNKELDYIQITNEKNEQERLKRLMEVCAVYEKETASLKVDEISPALSIIYEQTKKGCEDARIKIAREKIRKTIPGIKVNFDVSDF